MRPACPTAARPIPRTPARAARAILALSLALSLATATTGCMVIDELDSAAAKMPSSAQDKKKSAKGAPTGAPSSAAERLAAAKAKVNEHSKKWWSEAKSIAPGERPTGVVKCELDGGVQFMTRDDCVTHGGRTADAG